MFYCLFFPLNGFNTLVYSLLSAHPGCVFPASSPVSITLSGAFSASSSRSEAAAAVQRLHLVATEGTSSFLLKCCGSTQLPAATIRTSVTHIYKWFQTSPPPPQLSLPQPADYLDQGGLRTGVVC